MQSLDNNTQAFLALVRAGLWEQDVQLLPYGNIKWPEVYRLATEQSVLGLVLAGLEHSDVKPQKELLLLWIGEVQQIEQRNKKMNAFVADLIEKLRKANIYTLLVKGQGIAQCYERSLWRASGDVDFYLSESGFQEALVYLKEYAPPKNDIIAKHVGLKIGEWDVELHANQHIGLSSKIDRVLDEVHTALFYSGEVRSIVFEKTQVLLPSANNDVIIVFTHFLKHFYKGGLGLRQICDWCRLLCTYRDSIDLTLLETRVRRMGLMSEWKSFGAFSVDFLGVPKEVMPFYFPSQKWSGKAKRIKAFVLEVGNFGHNRGTGIGEKPFFVRKAISLSWRVIDTCNHVMIFPMDSLRFFPTIAFNGFRSALKGVG